jgi:hypothetical protein
MVGGPRRAKHRHLIGGSRPYGSHGGREDDPGEQHPRHGRERTQSPGACNGPGEGARIARAPSPALYYAAGAGADCGAAACLVRRKSVTDAAAIQTSQTSIGKKAIERIAATPAT